MHSCDDISQPEFTSDLHRYTDAWLQVSKMVKFMLEGHIELTTWQSEQSALV